MSFGIVKSIEVNFQDNEVQDMLSLLKTSSLPDRPPIDTDEPWKLGMDYEYLKKLKDMLETVWNSGSLESRISKFDNYAVRYENEGDSMDLHFVHARSQRTDAIPLILLHGWPGTFFDFHKVIEPLTKPASPELPAFHVVVPSLPGFFMSTLPRRDGWDLIDVAQLFNDLMTEVLGYSKYAGQGGDWGSMILRIMGNMFPNTIRIMHFNMFYVESAFDSDPSRFSDSEKEFTKRWLAVRDTGFGYSHIQATKPFTIGLAIASSPLAVLTYIGEKIYAWSDPELLDPKDILDTVALYYLTRSFLTSVVIYNQSIKQLRSLSETASHGNFLLKNPFGYSAFPFAIYHQPFELGRAPKVELEAFGPLVYLKEHPKGGHFPALDSPKEFVSDLREFLGEHWPRASE